MPPRWRATQHKAGEAEFSASWVGIGGGCIDAGCTATDATLIQAGTSQDVDSSGAGNYSAWWEIIPAPSTPIANLAVHAGEVIHVAIAETLPEVWSIWAPLATPSAPDADADGFSVCTYSGSCGAPPS